MIRWPMLACGAALLSGCVSPYPPYPTPFYLPPPYVPQPLVEAPRSGPVPLYPVPEPRREAPPPEPLEQTDIVPDPMPESLPEPEAANPVPETPAAPAPDIVVPSRPQDRPGADAPLQGFRPMRGQTRPGI